jgi:Flp pilus assembly pilin Flp
MKTLLIGIAIAVGMLVATRAVGSELTDCPHIVWKHGHYVCVTDDNG